MDVDPSGSNFLGKYTRVSRDFIMHEDQDLKDLQSSLAFDLSVAPLNHRGKGNEKSAVLNQPEDKNPPQPGADLIDFSDHEYMDSENIGEEWLMSFQHLEAEVSLIFWNDQWLEKTSLQYFQRHRLKSPNQELMCSWMKGDVKPVVSNHSLVSHLHSLTFFLSFIHPVLQLEEYQKEVPEKLENLNIELCRSICKVEEQGEHIMQCNAR